MSVIDDLFADGKLPKPLQKVDLEKERQDRIKQIGNYNAELLSRQKNPEELVVPVCFNVQMRVDSTVYGFSEFDDFPTKRIGFYRSLEIEKGDEIIAYLLAGKFEEMKAEGGLAYVIGRNPISVPLYGGRESLPRVLVRRQLGEMESALTIDILRGGKVVSRDLDLGLIDKYGVSLRKYFDKKNCELVEEIEKEVKNKNSIGL